MSYPDEIERVRIRALVAAEYERIKDQGTREQLRRHLVEPQRHMLRWDYATEPTTYPAWLVADFISYSEHGFGPKCPWGLASADGGGFGMDSGWFPTLHGVFLESWAWKPREITLDPTDWRVPTDALSALFDALKISSAINRSIETLVALIRGHAAGGIELPLQIYVLDKPIVSRELVDFQFHLAWGIIDGLCREGFSVRMIPRWQPSPDSGFVQAPSRPID